MDKFNQFLKQHYETGQLDDERINSILKSCEPARQIHRWRNLAVSGFSVAAAAIGVLLVVLLGDSQKNKSTQPVIAEEKSPIPVVPTKHYQLIAVKIHADPCGRCKKIAPVFTELKSEFYGEPVLFVTFDRTSEKSRRQAKLLSKRLGLEKFFEKQSYTGVIVFATPDGDVKEIVGTNTDITAATKLLEDSLTSG